MKTPSLRAEHDGQVLKIFRNVEGAPPALQTAAAKAATVLEGKENEQVELRKRATPILVQHAATGKRPYIHPIIAPDGGGELTENEPGHHLWQHGLYVGLNDVNGVGFWTEGLHAKNKAIDGSFHPHPLRNPMIRHWGDHTRAAWQVLTEWRAPESQGSGMLLQELQAWCLQDYETHYLLDLSWALTAETDLTFGQYAYGGLFLRMPFRDGGGGQAINSGGARDQACEAQPAKWVAIAMAIPGREKKKQKVCGIAMLDHPTNPGHPAPWRVDGQFGIAPSRSIGGPWELKKGATTRSRYRLFVHCGPTDPAAVEAHWEAFAKEAF